MHIYVKVILFKESNNIVILRVDNVQEESVDGTIERHHCSRKESRVSRGEFRSSLL